MCCIAAMMMQDGKAIAEAPVFADLLVVELSRPIISVAGRIADF
jgi:hypothetical protein